MLRYSEIKTYVDAGQTAAQIAATLNADPRHKHDILATGANFDQGQSDLLHVLAAKLQVLRLKADATWTGPIVDYFETINDQSPVEAQQLKAGFELLLTQLQISGRKVFTNSDPATGALASGIVAVCQSINPASQAELHALTGGPLYQVTESEVQDVIDQQARQDAYDAVDAKTNAALEAARNAQLAGQTPAEIQQAAETSWSGGGLT